MRNIDDFVRKDINNFCRSANGFKRRKVAALKVHMPVQMIAGSSHADKPIDGFESLMRQGLVIMDSKGRRMGDEDIERSPIVYSTKHQPGVKPKGTHVGFGLRVLVCPIRTILDGSAQAADQKFFVANQLQIQV